MSDSEQTLNPVVASPEASLGGHSEGILRLCGQSVKAELAMAGESRLSAAEHWARSVDGRCERWDQLIPAPGLVFADILSVFPASGRSVAL